MLFEKITRNDTTKSSDFEYIIYCRIKIFNAEGRQWGDYSIPYVHKKQKILDLRGRTVLPDGKEFFLSENQVFEKDLVKGEGVKVKQKSFSLPGITDGCIVEYYVKFRSPVISQIWQVQKNIALLNGEFVWAFQQYRGYLTEGIVKIIKENWTPNFMKYPDNFPIFSFWYPSYIKAKELHFSVKNVPALEDEPYSVSESMLKAQVRCYYGSSETAQKYWEETNNDSARAEAAYNWVQKNLKNIDYLESDEKFKDNKNLDDVIKRRYGTTEELNIVFYSLLHQMNIKARMAYVVDRDEGLFLPKAKYWQFDHSLVAVSVDSAKYQFMSPGYPYLPFTHVPRFTEGVQAYVLGDSTPSFINIPYSEPRINRIVRSLDLRLENDLTLQGGLVDSRIGIPARSIRIDLLNKTAAEREEKFRNDLNEILPNAEFDSITVEGLEETGTALKLQCKLQVSNPEQEIGSRLFIKPFSFFASVSNPFQAAKRSSPIMFNYANEVIELLKFELPETWKIEALPADTSFTNKAGYCVVKFSSFGQTLSVQRGFKLNRPNWSTLEYSYVRNLFQARQSFYELACVLKRTDTDKLN